MTAEQPSPIEQQPSLNSEEFKAVFRRVPRRLGVVAGEVADSTGPS